MEKSLPSVRSGYIIWISLISALGGYLFGFDFAVIAGALPFLRSYFALTPFWEGFATACLAFGCIVGCITAGGVSNRYGRKPALMASAVIFMISSLGMAFSGSRDLFLLTRFSAGIGVGMASILSPMYIAEIAPPSMRGRMVAVNQLTIVTGILVTNLVNYFLKDLGNEAWRWMFGMGAVPSSLFFCGVAALPESPRWLMRSGKKDQAVRVLDSIGGKAYVAVTLPTLERARQEQTKIKYTSVFEKAVRPAVVMGIILAAFQQLSGINVVFNFTTTIFESIGFSLDNQLRQTILIGIVNLLFTLIAMWQVDRLGRKPLMLFGSATLALLYILSAILLQRHSPAAAWSLLAAIGTYAMSLAPVTWVLISEIFPTRVRETAMTVAITSLWLSYALLVFTFPILARKAGAYTPFYFYAGICLAGFAFIWVRVKETKGKSLEQLGEEWSSSITTNKKEK
jgi:SP family xylose:H+ symportor-like MFS transporter